MVSRDGFALTSQINIGNGIQDEHALGILLVFFLFFVLEKNKSINSFIKNKISLKKTLAASAVTKSKDSAIKICVLKMSITGTVILSIMF